MRFEIDDTSRRILDELQTNARATYSEIGRRVGLTAPAVAERVRRLEDDGIITGYHAAINPRPLGLPITVFIQVISKTGQCTLISEFALRQPGVTECYHITGDRDVLIKASLDSVEAVEALVNRLSIHGNVSTSLVLAERSQSLAFTPPEK